MRSLNELVTSNPLAIYCNFHSRSKELEWNLWRLANDDIGNRLLMWNIFKLFIRPFLYIKCKHYFFNIPEPLDSRLGPIQSGSGQTGSGLSFIRKLLLLFSMIETRDLQKPLLFHWTYLLSSAKMSKFEQNQWFPWNCESRNIFKYFDKKSRLFV